MHPRWRHRRTERPDEPGGFVTAPVRWRRRTTLIGITFSSLFNDDAIQLALPYEGTAPSVGVRHSSGGRLGQ